MDITSAQLGDQNPWSRYAPVLGLSGLALLWAGAASFTLFQLIRAAGEARLVSLLQFGWLGYGLGLTVLSLTHIHRTGRANKRRGAELAEIRNLLAAEIEARQRAEARLRQNQHELSEGETRHRTILETTDSAIIVADQHGRIEQFNKAAESMTGYLAAEVIGENMRVLLPPNLRHEHYRHTARYLWTVRELEVCRKDGSLFAAELAIADWCAGGQRHFVGMLRDLTRQKQEQVERMRLEEQLHQAQKMEAIGSLTGGMAHDFNNLLGIIIGNTDLLGDLKTDDPEAEELTRNVLNAAFRGAELTRGMLAFARQQPLSPRRIDVNQLVSGIIRLLSRTLGENIEIVLSLSSEVSPIVADPAQLEAAIANLATNARDAMPCGGRLAVATADCRLDADPVAPHSELVPGQYVMIEVCDTGSGITQEVMNRIFEPFYTTKGRDKGTGLGLSMVFGFIEQSGGHINVSSEPGVGTTFRLFLPRATGETVVVTESAVAQLLCGEGETILVVEDNDALRRVIGRQLSSLGYRVLEAKQADAALRVMEQESAASHGTRKYRRVVDGYRYARRQRWHRAGAAGPATVAGDRGCLQLGVFASQTGWHCRFNATRDATAKQAVPQGKLGTRNPRSPVKSVGDLSASGQQKISVRARCASGYQNCFNRQRSGGSRMTPGSWGNLPAMFFDWAARLGEKPFLWAKREGRYCPITWAVVARDVRRAA